MAFGAKVKLQVDSTASAASQFRKQIQEQVDKATATKPIKISNVQINTSKTQLNSALKALREALSSDNNGLVVKIQSIDASAAISKLREQLKGMLSGLSITGVQDFVGDSEGLTKKVAEASAQMDQLKATSQDLVSIYKQISKIDVNSSAYKEQLATYEKLVAEAETLKNDEKSRTQEAVSNLSQETALLKQTAQATLERQAAEQKVTAETAQGKANLEQLNTLAKSLKNTYESLVLSSAGGETEELTQAEETYRSLKEQVESLKLSADSASESSIAGLRQEVALLEDKARVIAGLPSYSEQVEAAEQKEAATEYNLLTQQANLLRRIQEYQAQNVTVAEKNADTFTRWIDTLSTKGSVGKEAIAQIRAEFARLQQVSYEDDSSIKSITEENSLLTKQHQLLQQIQDYAKANPQVYQQNIGQFTKWISELESAGVISAETASRTTSEFTTLKQEASAAEMTGKSFFQTLQAGWEKFGTWGLVTKSFTVITQQFKKLYNAVVDVDDAMTELKKVTDLTAASYREFLDEAADIATAVGASLSDTVNATADFARLGYTVEESAELAEAALVYLNVGDGLDDISEATESLISTIKAFGIEAEDAMNIVDMFNEVGNNFAISSSGIGEALENSASALAAANNTLEESIALVTAANSVVQDPAKVGTAMKTYSMYLRAASTEAEEAGISTDGMANSVSELRQELLTLTNQKVDIMIDDSTFKSTYEITKELSEVWDELSDVDQANILELIGGKRNSTVISSLLTNFEEAEAALETTQNATGSAVEENERYLESISGMLSVLEAQFQEIANNVLDSSVIKFVLELVTALTSLIDTMTQTKLGTIALVGVITALSTIFRLLRQNIIANTAADLAQKKELNSESIVTQSLVAQIEKLNVKRKEALALSISQKMASQGLSAAEIKENLNTLGLSGAVTALGGAEKVATTSANGLTVALTGIQAAIPVIGLVVTAITAITSVITAVSNAVDDSEDKLQELMDTAEEVTTTFEEANNTYKSNVDTLEGLREQYEKLSKGVDENGESVSLSSSEYKEYLDIVEQIVDISPEAIQGYDSEGNAILNYTTLLEDAIAAQEAYLENERSIYLASGDTIFEGANATYKSVVNELDEQGQEMLDLIRSFTSRSEFNELFDTINEQFNTGIHEDIGDWTGVIYNDGNIKKLYDNAQAFLAILEESGLYTRDELIQIEDYLSNLESVAKEIDTETGEVAVWMLQRLSGEDWYSLIPTDALDEFSDGMESAIDISKTYAENLELATSYGEMFAEALSSDASQSIYELADAFNEGTVSQEEWNTALKEFSNNWDGDENVLNTLLSYFDHLATGVETTGTYIKSISDLSDTIDDLTDSYDILSTAMEEMASGDGLSADTLKDIIDAMEDGEDYLDYLEVENGVLVLNTEKWLERANATALGDITEIQTETANLQKQNAELEEQLALLDPESDEYKTLTAEIKENNEKIKENQVLLTTYNSILDELSDSLYDYFNFDNMYDALDEIGEGLTELFDAMDTLADGTALTEAELWDLAEVYPELLKYSNLFTDGSIEGQEAMLQSLLDVYEAEYDATIDTKIAELKATKEALEAELALEIEKAEKVAELNGTALDSNVSSILSLGQTTYHRTSSSSGLTALTQQSEAAATSISSQVSSINAAIKNLESLKGLDLKSLYGSSSSSSSSSNSNDVDEYLATIEDYYDALKRLEKAQELRESIENQIDNSDDPLERISLSRQLIEAYEEEAAAEANLMEQQTATIEANVEALRELGFEVEYNNETNELYIANLEHINELTADACGEYDSLQEATNALRESTEDLIDATEDLNDDNKEAASTIEDIGYSIKSTKNDILDYIQEAVDNASDSLSEVTNVFDTLQDAVTSYNETGYMTVDCFQSILSLGTKYISLLYDESGAIKFDEEALQELIAAKVNDLAITQALALIDTIKEHLDDAEALRELADATYTATDATWDFVYAELAAVGLEDEELYNAFYNQIQTIQKLAESTISGISSTYSTSAVSMSDYYSDANDALEKILDLTEELIEYEVNQQIDALEDQIDAYQAIIDAKKEVLELDKDESDYEEEVADLVSDIAELQTKIAQLSLDDSRSAQAEKAELEEELAEKQKELADTQNDYSLEKQEATLDSMASAYEDEKQTEIDALEESISSTERLYQAAIARINSSWSTLYSDIVAYNYEAGNTITSEITEAWLTAAQAVQTYGSYVSAVTAITAGLDSTSSTSGTTIASYIPTFHTGGLVGENSNKQEVLALLQKGELVLNDDKQDTLYEIIDFQEELAKRLGTVIGTMSLPSNINPTSVSTLPTGSDNIQNSVSMDFSPQVSVNITGTVDSSDVESVGKKIADNTISELYKALSRKGITSSKLASALKP